MPSTLMSDEEPMYNPLIDHAIKTVWCIPEQDRHVIIKGARLSKLNGVWHSTKIANRTYLLPENYNRFHVFQIGQLHPVIMGLFDIKNKWEKFSDCCIKQKMLINLYTNSGILLPLTNCWYRITEDRNLVFAVKEQKTLDYDFNTHEIYLRVYSNAWFSSYESDPTLDKVDVQGGMMNTTADILALQTTFEAAKLLPGYVYAVVNGRVKHAINLLTVHVGDYAEYVYDSSVLKVIELPVSSLETFNSTLDTKHKYLIHYTEPDTGIITYHDEVDMYLIDKTITNTVDGVYYHRNRPDSVRMLTHRDYSIPVQYVVGLASINPAWTDPEKLFLRLVIRKSAYSRPLINDNNRIKELYKLGNPRIKQAMVGVNAVVSNWTADNLENSAYTRIMRSSIPQITMNMVEQAYGYNCISRLLGETPKLTRDFSGRKLVTLPYGLIDNSTAYEYDADGLLIDWHHHTHGYHYTAASNNANLVEVITGTGSDELDDTFGQQTQLLDPNFDYRMYICGYLYNEPDNKWVDVTDTSSYAIINGTLTWLTDPGSIFTCVRSNKKFLGYDLTTVALDGVIRFSFDQIMSRDNDREVWVMQIPMGELDIFLNGRSLIEGLDYHVNFPEVVVINKAYLNTPAPTTAQHLTIRFTGFCKQDMTRDIPKEIGFVDHLLLSNNSKFDIRDDKVMRIVVNGATKHRGLLQFAEQDQGVSVLDNRNGDPYMLRDIVVPTRGYTATKTYQLRTMSQVIDKRVSDYMSTRIPKPTFPGPNIINERYPVFSPFCCKIIYELIHGNLNDPRLVGEYSDQDVLEICAPYEYLLKSDPTQPGLEPDENYVIIHPTNLNTLVTINLYQHKFLNRVIRLYLRNKVTLNHFIQLTP